MEPAQGPRSPGQLEASPGLCPSTPALCPLAQVRVGPPAPGRGPHSPAPASVLLLYITRTEGTRTPNLGALWPLPSGVEGVPQCRSVPVAPLSWAPAAGLWGAGPWLPGLDRALGRDDSRRRLWRPRERAGGCRVLNLLSSSCFTSSLEKPPAVDNSGPTGGACRPQSLASAANRVPAPAHPVWARKQLPASLSDRCPPPAHPAPGSPCAAPECEWGQWCRRWTAPPRPHLEFHPPRGTDSAGRGQSTRPVSTRLEPRAPTLGGGWGLQPLPAVRPGGAPQLSGPRLPHLMGSQTAVLSLAAVPSQRLFCHSQAAEASWLQMATTRVSASVRLVG